MEHDDDDDEGATVMGPAVGADARLPFAPASVRAPAARPATWAGTMAREVGLSLGEMALLSAEEATARSPAEVHARYGLDAMTYVAETAAWERRFAADPQLRARFTAACQRCRARLGAG